MDKSVVIETRKLSKTYKSDKRVLVEALKDVDISIHEKELVAVIGTSGSGKSTFLHILGGIDADYEGEYILDGEDISKLNHQQMAKIRNEKIGIVLQHFGLISEMSVYDNIALQYYLGKKKIAKDVLYEKVETLLKEVGLTEKMNTRVSLLSGGQKQRVAIARALIESPSVILADEPTGALDQKTSSEIMQVFEHLNEQGHTIIIVTHDMNIAKRCHRIFCILDGRLSELES